MQTNDNLLHQACDATPQMGQGWRPTGRDKAPPPIELQTGIGGGWGEKGARAFQAVHPPTGKFYLCILVIHARICGVLLVIWVLTKNFFHLLGGVMGLDVIVTMRLSEDVVAHIDGLVGRRGRSGFMRGAIVAALGKNVTGVKKGTGGAIPRSNFLPKLSDADALLAAVRDCPMTVREASEHLGWDELRAVRAAGELSDGGLVHCPRGMGIMEVTDGAR